MTRTITIIAAIVSLGTLSFVMKNDGLEGRTGSPGETTCNTSGCHSGNALNSPTGSITISAPTMTNWQYIPGTSYTIQVTVNRTGNSKFGFGFESLQASGANGGSFQITSATTTQLKSAVVSGNVRTNVVHKNNGGVSANFHTFTFNWVAPATNIGNITFYAAGNAANGLNNTSGDWIFTTSQVITPTAVGIDEQINLIENLTVMPNPVSENFEVKFSLQQETEAEIFLTDLLGARVKDISSGKFHHGENTLKCNIESDVKNGIYLLQIKSDNRISTKKIVVIR